MLQLTITENGEMSLYENVTSFVVDYHEGFMYVEIYNVNGHQATTEKATFLSVLMLNG